MLLASLADTDKPLTKLEIRENPENLGLHVYIPTYVGQ